MRALVVTNMYPSAARPAFGSFVRDQVEALRQLPGLEVDLFAFEPGGARYASAARSLRRRLGTEQFDVIHAHFGLSGWPALALRGAPHAVTFHGTDLNHWASRKLSLASVPLLDLPAVVSATLGRAVPGAGIKRRVGVLPCGVDLKRFKPIDRDVARRKLGLDESKPYLLFPAAPDRPLKRHDLALEVAGETELLTLGSIEPDLVPFYINAANAVLLPSELEGFGLAALEALACNVPILTTPAGIAPLALSGIDGTLCADFNAELWRTKIADHTAVTDPRVDGRGRAELFSATRMAERVAAAWRDLTAEGNAQ